VADAWLRAGVDPDLPDEVMLIVVVDPAGTAGERAVSSLGMSAYEGDGAFYLARTDGWVERRLDNRTLTVDVVAYPVVLDDDIELAEFTERSAVDPAALRLLRVTATVDPVLYRSAVAGTVIWKAPAGSSVDQVLAAIQDQSDWPLLCAPPPTPAN
jgi:hypothetical protein